MPRNPDGRTPVSRAEEEEIARGLVVGIGAGVTDIAEERNTRRDGLQESLVIRRATMDEEIGGELEAERTGLEHLRRACWWLGGLR